MNVPTRSKRWIYCIGWIRTMLFILFLQDRSLTEHNPDRIDYELSVVLELLYIYPGHSRSLLIGSYFWIGRLSSKFGIWEFPGKVKSGALHYCPQARTRSLIRLAFAFFWRNVRRFSKAYHLTFRDQVLLTAFFDTFPKGWWWKMSGGNRNLH